MIRGTKKMKTLARKGSARRLRVVFMPQYAQPTVTAFTSLYSNDSVVRWPRVGCNHHAVALGDIEHKTGYGDQQILSPLHATVSKAQTGQTSDVSKKYRSLEELSEYSQLRCFR
jgi:hypothetical protein